MRAACFQGEALAPLALNRLTTQGEDETPLERLIRLIEQTWPKQGQVAGIGVTAPGPINPYEGIVIDAPNIPGWENLPLRQLLEDHFHVRVAAGNDANLAALGEWRFGAGQGFHHMIYLTISTGIGGGVIVNDQLLLGSQGLAAELGHITVVPDGPLCGCGQRGHLEAIASGPSIVRWVEEEINNGVPSRLAEKMPLTAKDVSEAAQQGDTLSQAALARAGTFIGVAIADYLHIFNPSAVIIGGGVSQSGPVLMKPLRTALREHVMSPKFLDHLTIAPAALGDSVGLMGALALVRDLAAS